MKVTSDGNIELDVDLAVSEASLKALDNYLKKFEDGLLKIQKSSARTWIANLEYLDKEGKKISTSTKLNRKQVLELSSKPTFGSAKKFLVGVEQKRIDDKNKKANDRRIAKEKQAIKDQEKAEKEKKQREDQERKDREKADKERKQREDQERKDKERADIARMKEEEKARKEAEKARKEEEKLQKAEEKEREKERQRQERIKKFNLRQQRGAQFLDFVSQATTGPADSIRAGIAIKQYDLSLLKKQFLEVEDEGSGKFQELKTRIVETQKEIDTLQKKLKKVSNVSQLQKLINTFKRVGFYRIARRFFQVIEQGIGESVKGLAEFSPDVNKTLSSITSSVDKMSASIVLTIYPVIQSVEPLIASIADKVATFAEGVSKASSALRGESRYLKINDEYLKSMVESANNMNASFDKFESLNGKESLYEWGDMNPEEMAEAQKSSYAEFIQTVNNLMKTVESVGNVVWDILVDIGKAIEVILPHLIDFIESVTDIVTKIVVWLDKNELLKPTIYAIGIALATIKITKFVKDLVEVVRVLGGLPKLFKNWNSAMHPLVNTLLAVTSAIATFEILKEAPQWVKWLTLIIAAVTALAVAALVARESISKGLGGAIAAIATGVAFGATLSLIADGVKKSIPVETYATGGMVDRGSLFVAGEAGAELVTTMPSGQTGVTNIAQFRQAMSEALFEWWSDAKYDLPEGSSYGFNGADVARSKSFINEFNRRNSGIKIK